jgi:hypothetical protein
MCGSISILAVHLPDSNNDVHYQQINYIVVLRNGPDLLVRHALGSCYLVFQKYFYYHVFTYPTGKLQSELNASRYVGE